MLKFWFTALLLTANVATAQVLSPLDNQSFIVDKVPSKIQEVVVKPEIMSLFAQSKNQFILLMTMSKSVKSYNEKLDNQILDAALMKANQYLKNPIKLCIGAGKAVIVLASNTHCSSAKQQDQDLVIGINRFS